MIRWPAVVMLAALGAAVTSRAGAQGTGRSLDLDPSPISAGMGGASNAMFWGDPNDWGNPALLAYHAGVRYAHTREPLVPGLAADVLFTTNQFTLGAYGLGVSVASNARVDYGTSEGVDPNGNPTGTFRSYEKVGIWGAGVSVASVLDATVLRGAPGIGRFADVAVGYKHKHIDIALAPASQQGLGSSPAADIGLLVRVTPLDTRWFPTAPLLPVRIDASYGHSVLNHDDRQIRFINEDQASTLTRHQRDGWAVRGTLGWPAGLQAPPWLAELLTPLLSVAHTSDHDRLSAGGAPPIDRLEGSGTEIGVANVAWFRTGHFTDPLGAVDDDTSGWGVGLASRFGGIRYDSGSTPQARESGLPDRHRHSFTVTLQPLAIARALR
jgi:hypothetical protein